MAKNEKSGTVMASIAARVIRDPNSASRDDMVALAACVLTQAPDHVEITGASKKKRKYSPTALAAIIKRKKAKKKRGRGLL